MVEATWNGSVIARSDDTVQVEGNHYFPADAVEPGVLVPNDRRTRCHWKGEASYFDVVVDGEVNSAAAWTYEEPLPKAEEIRGRIAFWGGVKVSDDSRPSLRERILG